MRTRTLSWKRVACVTTAAALLLALVVAGLTTASAASTAWAADYQAAASPASSFTIPEGATSGTWGSDEYAATWYLADGGDTLVVGPGVVCTSKGGDGEGAIVCDRRVVHERRRAELQGREAEPAARLQSRYGNAAQGSLQARLDVPHAC